MARQWSHEPPREHLVGRAEDVGVISSFLRRAMCDGGAQLLTGDPGMGKTALVESAVRQAAPPFGARVLRATGVEFEAELSFAGLNQLLLPVADTLADLPEAYRAPLSSALGLERGEPPERLALATAALRWLQALSGAAPLVLVVDDLHWVDRSSALVLSLLARRLAGHRVALLLAQRSGQLSYFDRAGIPDHHLQPLDDEEAVALLRGRHPGLHSSVRQRIVAEAGGNPLALIELPRGLTTEQEAAGYLLPSALTLGDRLTRLFSSRVAALPAPTRRLLLLAALDRGDRAALMEVVAHSAVDLAPAEVDGLVRVDARARRVVFAHPLIRSATVQLASAPERRAAHRRLAQLATDPEVRALHLAESALGLDDDIAALLVEVAESALGRGDTVQAVGILLRAADLTSGQRARAQRLAAAAYIGANVTGTLAGARDLLEQAHLADPNVTATLEASTAAAAHLLNSDGDIDTAHRILVAALAHTPFDPSDVRRHEDALDTLMMVCTFGGRPELWRAFDELVVRCGSALRQPLRVASVTFADPVRSTPELLRELDDLLGKLDGETNPVRVVEVGRAGFYVDRLPGAALERVVADGREGGAVALAVQALIMLATRAFYDGRWDEAARRADEGIALCEEHDYRLLLWGALNPRMLLAAARADADYLDAARARMRQWAIPRGALAVQTFTANVDGLAALSLGRFHDAYAQYSSIAPPGTFPEHDRVSPWSVLDVVEAAVGSGHVAEARRHAAAAVRAGIPSLSPRLRFMCEAAAALTADDGDDETIGRLVSGPEAQRAPFHLARLELAHGERLRHARAVRRARPHLERAVALFTALDALPWAHRAAAALRATGASRPSPAAPAPGALTPQELEVARLAASGLTNRQIGERLHLSPRTVGAHLYRVFPKLGITSRAALRDALTERGQ